MYKNSISISALDFSELSRWVFEPYLRRNHSRTHLFCQHDTRYVSICRVRGQVAAEREAPAHADKEKEDVSESAEDWPG